MKIAKVWDVRFGSCNRPEIQGEIVSVEKVRRKIMVRFTQTEDGPRPTYVHVRYRFANPIHLTQGRISGAVDAFAVSLYTSPKGAFGLRWVRPRARWIMAGSSDPSFNIENFRIYIPPFIFEGDFHRKADGEFWPDYGTVTTLAGQQIATARRYTPDDQLEEVKPYYDLGWEEGRLYLLNTASIETELVKAMEDSIWIVFPNTENGIEMARKVESNLDEVFYDYLPTVPRGIQSEVRIAVPSNREDRKYEYVPLSAI